MGWKTDTGIWIAKGLGKIVLIPWRVTMPNRSWSLRLWPRAAELWRFSRFGLSSAEKTAIARLPGRYRDSVKKAKNYQRLAKASGLDVDSTKAIRQITGPLQQRERLLQTSMFEAEHQAALAGASEGIIGTLKGEIVQMTKEEAAEMGVAQAMVAAVKTIEDAAQTHASGIMRAKLVELGQLIETVGDLEKHKKSIKFFEGPRNVYIKALKQAEAREFKIRRQQPWRLRRLRRGVNKTLMAINKKVRQREKMVARNLKVMDPERARMVQAELAKLRELRDEVKATTLKLNKNVDVLRAFARETKQLCQELRNRLREGLKAKEAWRKARVEYKEEREVVAKDADRFKKR